MQLYCDYIGCSIEETRGLQVDPTVVSEMGG
jgi:hypothetical protein